MKKLKQAAVDLAATQAALSAVAQSRAEMTAAFERAMADRTVLINHAARADALCAALAAAITGGDPQAVFKSGADAARAALGEVFLAGAWDAPAWLAQLKPIQVPSTRAPGAPN